MYTKMRVKHIQTILTYTYWKHSKPLPTIYRWLYSLVPKWSVCIIQTKESVCSDESVYSDDSVYLPRYESIIRWECLYSQKLNTLMRLLMYSDDCILRREFFFTQMRVCLPKWEYDSYKCLYSQRVDSLYKCVYSDESVCLHRWERILTCDCILS